MKGTLGRPDGLPRIKETARVKVWSKDGTVIYSNNPGGVGRQFPNNQHLRSALRGERAAVVTALNSNESSATADVEVDEE